MLVSSCSVVEWYKRRRWGINGCLGKLCKTTNDTRSVTEFPYGLGLIIIIRRFFVWDEGEMSMRNIKKRENRRTNTPSYSP